MQWQALLPPALASVSCRNRFLRSLIFFSFFPSSMETGSLFSSSIDATDASSAAAEQGKGTLLTSSVSVDASEESAEEFGFKRKEFGRESLVGTVQSYDRHVFFRYKSPEVWSPNVEASESDSLPRLLAAAIKARKNDMKDKLRLTICGVDDNDVTTDGDILIFPERTAYRGLTDVNVDNFVELVLVKDTEWLHGPVKRLLGSYVFVCAHGSRDRRCGACGPILIEKFKKEIFSRGLEGEVFVSPCSHIGGHKYAGNVIIFSQSKIREVSGHWYGYVSPDDVPMLLEQHIGKGEIVEHLWRGEMGLSEEEQRKAQNMRRQPENGMGEKGASGCCQGNGNLRCCQDTTSTAKPNAGSSMGKSSSISNVFSPPAWLKEPGRDAYAAFAVVAAIASVGGAYCYYRNLR